MAQEKTKKIDINNSNEEGILKYLKKVSDSAEEGSVKVFDSNSIRDINKNLIGSAINGHKQINSETQHKKHKRVVINESLNIEYKYDNSKYTEDVDLNATAINLNLNLVKIKPEKKHNKFNIFANKNILEPEIFKPTKPTNFTQNIDNFKLRLKNYNEPTISRNSFYSKFAGMSMSNDIGTKMMKSNNSTRVIKNESDLTKGSSLSFKNNPFILFDKNSKRRNLKETDLDELKKSTFNK